MIELRTTELVSEGICMCMCVFSVLVARKKILNDIFENFGHEIHAKNYYGFDCIMYMIHWQLIF